MIYCIIDRIKLAASTLASTAMRDPDRANVPGVQYAKKKYQFDFGLISEISSNL